MWLYLTRYMRLYMLRRRDFEKIQGETGFDIDMLEKAYHLTRILSEMHDNEFLFNNITLKGGTALNFLYLDISRLSIDLDFNFTGSIEKEEMEHSRPEIEKNIEKLGEELGYRVVRKPPSYILSRHNLQYTTIRNTKDHIKIEINYLDRLPIGNIVEGTMALLFPDIEPFTLKTYTLEELTAQKIKACMERTEPRDIYDVYRLSNQNLELGLAQKYITVYYCMTEGNTNLGDFLKSIRTYDPEKLGQEIRQFIRANEDLNVEMIRTGAAHFLKQMLTFEGDEKKFIDIFYHEKRIAPELLFKNRVDIAHHPSLIHRITTLEAE